MSCTEINFSQEKKNYKNHHYRRLHFQKKFDLRRHQICGQNSYPHKTTETEHDFPVAVSK